MATHGFQLNSIVISKRSALKLDDHPELHRAQHRSCFRRKTAFRVLFGADLIPIRMNCRSRRKLLKLRVYETCSPFSGPHRRISLSFHIYESNNEEIYDLKR